MQASHSHELNRSKSGNADKKPPPPIKPKPLSLSSNSTEPQLPSFSISSSSSFSSSSTATTTTSAAPSSVQRTTITVTDNGEASSSSFGDLKKAFERNQNSSPLFSGGVGNLSGTSSSSSGNPNRTSLPRMPTQQQKQQSSSNLNIPLLNIGGGVSGNRPRSVSSPAPAFRDTDDVIAESTNHKGEGEGERDGIDNRQPDFSNLRARFQSQANISGANPDTQRSKPPKPTINQSKPNYSAVSSPPAIKPSRFSMDSIASASSAPVSRFSSPKPPPPPPSLSGSSSTLPLAQPPRLAPSSSAGKLPPRFPPALKSAIKTPTPPRTPPRAESPESERNPFGDDDDDNENSRNNTSQVMDAPPAYGAKSELGRTPSKIQQNPIFNQLNNALSNGGGGLGIRPTPLAAIPGRDSGGSGGRGPQIPQRTLPQPTSPPSGLPPRLPSRSSSSTTLESPNDSPEEKERKHRLDKRRRVIQELLETEVSFSKDMLLLQEVYVTDMAESGLFTQVDEKTIFMNLGEVIDLTVDFIELLTPACGSSEGSYNDESTFVGEAFLQITSRIRRVFSEYCKRQEASAQHLLELEGRRDLKPFFDACTEKCQGRTTTWDLASMIIKPVQRVLKYPLLINQIYGLTPPDHPDYENLANLQKEMLQIAEEINDIKKRKDIVEKIVGPKKKNDSDLVHGFSKKLSRTTQQIRQAVGGSEGTVDILFEALLEKFNSQQRLAREFVNHILAWLVAIKQYFDTQESFALTLREIYVMVPIHRNNENKSIDLVTEFHKSLSQFSRTIGRELEARLKKTVYKSIENFLKLFAGPLQVMKKREKKLLDYDRVNHMKEREETIDKNMLESAAAYTAINEQLVDELPKFLGLTTQYFDLIVVEFSKVQMFFYQQVKSKVFEYYVKFIDPSASRDTEAYLSAMDLCEDYIAAMIRDDGPLARLQRNSLVKDVDAIHDVAFQEMRETNERRRRRRTNSAPLPPRPRSSSTAEPPGPIQTLPQVLHSKSTSLGGGLMDSPSGMENLQSPIYPRYFPGHDENPFEIPESIFHDGPAVSYDYDNSGGVFGSRPLSTASSSYSFGSGGVGGGAGGSSSEYQDFSSSKPPAMDEGLDTDEIGLAQALFECTAIYPYASTEPRHLNFEAGESIVVFGLNDDGWYFGKKVGKEETGWFPASHCIQF